MRKAAMTWGTIFLAAGILLLGTFYLPGCRGTGNDSGPEAGTIGNTVSLSGSEEVPLVVTGASASGVIEVNPETGVVSGHLTIATPPASPVVAVHIQEGVRGVNGCIVIILEDGGGGVWNVPAGTVIHPSDMEAFTAGKLYFNVRTEANPLGEIRGQIDAGP